MNWPNRLMVRRSDIAVVTNDFVIAAFLMREADCRLYHTGGQVERENQSCVGDPAAEAIRRFNFDLAFISTSSFGLRGVSTPSENKVAVKRAVAQSASRSILANTSRLRLTFSRCRVRSARENSCASTSSPMARP